MKKFLFSSLTIGLLASVFAFKKESASLTKLTDASGPSANGQGFVVPTGVTEEQQFSFHANTDKSGAVSGSWESYSPGQNTRTHGDITCLTILPDGKTAVMSGVVTQINADNPFGLTVGTPVWFKVQDGGEGANADADKFTDYYFGLTGCVDYGGALRPTLNGNIQVKP
jgi:hypothetical protein